MQRSPQDLGEGIDIPPAGNSGDCLTQFRERR
jgi:hypothetical protein